MNLEASIAWLGGFAYTLLGTIYHATLVDPIRRLYVLGPDYIGWAGKSDTQICSILTNTPEYLWVGQKDACEHLIHKKITSILVVIETLVYFYTLCRVAHYAIWYMMQRNAIASHATASAPAAHVP